MLQRSIGEADSAARQSALRSGERIVVKPEQKSVKLRERVVRKNQGLRRQSEIFEYFYDGQDDHKSFFVLVIMGRA